MKEDSFIRKVISMVYFLLIIIIGSLIYFVYDQLQKQNRSEKFSNKNRLALLKEVGSSIDKRCDICEEETENITIIINENGKICYCKNHSGLQIKNLKKKIENDNKDNNAEV